MKLKYLAAASAAVLALGLATQVSAQTVIQLAYSPTPTTPSTDISSKGVNTPDPEISLLSNLGLPTGVELSEYGLSNSSCIQNQPNLPPCTYVAGSDVNYTTANDQGIMAMDLTFAGQIPSGNEDLTITLSPAATFGVPFNPSMVTFTPFNPFCTSETVAASSGGGGASNTVTFLVSGSSGLCPGFIHLEIPVNVGVGLGSTLSNVTVTTTFVTDGFHTPIGGNGGIATYVNAITFAPALTEGTLPELQDNNENTYASLLDYRTLGPDHQLGDAWADVKDFAHYDLVNDHFTESMLTNTKLVVTGGFGTIAATIAHDLLHGDVIPGATGVLPSTCTDDPSLTFCTASATNAGSWIYAVSAATLPNLPVIQPSPYSATVSANLANSIYATTPDTFTGPLNPLGRQGAFAIVPWTASAVQGTMSGSSNMIRVSNIGASPTGPVLVEVLASTCHPANTTAPCTGADPVGLAPFQLTPSIAPGTEFMVDPAAVAAGLAEFGRGDLKITVVADPRTVTLKKEIMRNNTLSDQQLGSFADGQAASTLVGEQNIAPASLQFNEPPGVNTTCVAGTNPSNCVGVGNNPLNNQNLSGGFIPWSVANQGVTTPPASNPDNPPPFAPPF